MKEEIEKRLHRVKINFKNEDINCPYSNICNKATYGKRCNTFFKKCSIYQQKKDPTI